jgi:hypothetical protein
VARVAARIPRLTGPSAIARTAMPGQRPFQGEVGKHRDGEPASDERAPDGRVVRAVPDVRIEASELAAAATGDGN